MLRFFFASCRLNVSFKVHFSLQNLADRNNIVEYVVFVSASPLQKAMFEKILHPDNLSSLIRGSMARSLALIQLLTKLSNSPALFKSSLMKNANKSEGTSFESKESLYEAMNLVPANALPEHVALSGECIPGVIYLC